MYIAENKYTYTHTILISVALSCCEVRLPAHKPKQTYSTSQNKLCVIYYSITVPRSDRYRVVLRMQHNVNV